MIKKAKHILLWSAYIILAVICSYSTAFSQDEYHLYIGTIDGSSFPVPAHDTVDIPVFISGPRIGSGTIPLFSVNQYISDRLGGNFYLGNNYSFSNPQYFDQFIRQDLTFAPSIWGEGIFQLADFTVVMNVDSAYIGYSVNAFFTLGVLFSDTLGHYIIDPTLHVSQLLILGSNAAEEPISNTDNFALLDVYPKPFNSSTTIRFSLSEPSDVSLAIYDITGREVKSYIFSGLKAGENSIIWNGIDNNGQGIASGTYGCCLSNNKNSVFSRVTLIK